MNHVRSIPVEQRVRGTIGIRGHLVLLPAGEEVNPELGVVMCQLMETIVLAVTRSRKVVQNRRVQVEL